MLRGPNEQPVQRLLTVGGIGAEIGEVGLEPGIGPDRPVHVRVHMAVERQGQPGAQPLAQGRERSAAGVAEHEIEPAEAFDRQVVHRLAGLQPGERHRRVHVVEDAERRRFSDEGAGRAAVRAVGGDHRHIGLAHLRRRP